MNWGELYYCCNAGGHNIRTSCYNSALRPKNHTMQYNVCMVLFIQHMAQKKLLFITCAGGDAVAGDTVFLASLTASAWMRCLILCKCLHESWL